MSSLFAPFTPNHVNLINACYPPSAALVAPNSNCQPLSQELSRLTYYASNKADTSGKLAKLGIELERRANSESRKARTGSPRARAQLLVTMSIFKAITNECKRDVGLFTRMLLSAVRDGLQCLPNDLEVQARVASVFTAWATFTDGKVIGLDPKLTNDYIIILKTLQQRCTVTGRDSEHVNRMRLIGIASLNAAVSSDAFYVSAQEFTRQVGLAIPALLASIHEAGTSLLTDEYSIVKADPLGNSPYLSEFQNRPVADRRAASIHAHIDGQKGPELADVVNASLRAMQNLLGRCNGTQVGLVLDSILQAFEKAHLWEDVALGKWYAERVTEWTQYQYRYAVPTRLVDRLLKIQESPKPLAKHFRIIDMLTTVFTSPSPVINLSTSDVISSLITILLRRVSIDSNDDLLSPLVECISSLGTHVYYADQIHDLAEEVISRIVNVQLNGVLGRGRGGNETGREAALKCLLSCLSGLIEAADHHASKYQAKLAEDEDQPKEEEEARPPSESTSTTVRTARRNKVSPESWQETLALLCESNYSIRAMYARGLATFIQREVKREPFVLQEEGNASGYSLRRFKVVVDPEYKVSSRPSIMMSDPISRFLNALHASVFTLATSATNVWVPPTPSAEADPSNNNIRIIPPSSSNLPSPGLGIAIDTTNIAPSVPASPKFSPVPPSTAGSAASSIHPGTENLLSPSRKQKSRDQGDRKLSVAMSLLEGTQASLGTTLSDFTLIQHILVCIHYQVPCRAVLTGIPMLLNLGSLVRKQLINQEYQEISAINAIRELLGHVWKTIGEIWGVDAIVTSATIALEALQPTKLPRLPPGSPTRASFFDEPVELPKGNNGDNNLDLSGCIDTETVVTALASSEGLQAVTGLDRSGILRRLMIDWSVENALKDSVEHGSNQEILRGDTPFLKLSPALMQFDNMSLASLARTTHGGVGVGDLREALARGSVSNPALATAASGSSLSRSSSVVRRLDQRAANSPEHPALSRIKTRRGRAPPSEVRDVLNKLGIGKQSASGMALLRAPFPSTQKPSSKEGKKPEEMALVDPPY